MPQIWYLLKKTEGDSCAYTKKHPDFSQNPVSELYQVVKEQKTEILTRVFDPQIIVLRGGYEKDRGIFKDKCQFSLGI